MADCPIDLEEGERVSMAEVRGFYPRYSGRITSSADDCDQDEPVVRTVNTIVVMITEQYNNEQSIQ